MSKEKLFSFNTPEHKEYKLKVASFKGTQAINELYSYDIELISKNEDIDFDKMLQTEVSLQLHNKGNDDTYIHGVLSNFEAYQKIDEYIYYRATLVPKLWWLTLAHFQQIFLDEKLEDIFRDILTNAHFVENTDYEFLLKANYDKREFVCQYKESRYNFMLRWMQRDGIYFYFKQDKNGCKLIITDDKQTQEKAPQQEELLYRPVSGLQNYNDQALRSIVYRSNHTIKSVKMKNHSYLHPSVNSDASNIKDDFTQVYMFGHNLHSKSEAEKLTEVNEQKFKCKEKEMYGESNILSLNSGYIYSLKDYFKKTLNDDYLMVSVESEGSQKEYLLAGFTKDSDDGAYFNNIFMMIPAQTQFRGQTTLPWAHIGGMLSATIDAQGDGETAELDKYGRYKVIMPFDVSGKKDAKASAHLRMAQPSAGAKQGMHFPLHKGTEVLIAFKGGDPDQPIITGAVPNLDAPSPITDTNATYSAIETHGGNIIHMEDTPGKAHIHMSVHDGLSSMTLHNESTEKDIFGIEFKTEGSSNTYVKGNILEKIMGAKEEFVLGGVTEVVVGGEVDVVIGAKVDIALGPIFFKKTPTLIDLKFGSKVEWIKGPAVIKGSEMTRTHDGKVTTECTNKEETVKKTLTTTAGDIKINATEGDDTTKTVAIKAEIVNTNATTTINTIAPTIEIATADTNAAGIKLEQEGPKVTVNAKNIELGTGSAGAIEAANEDLASKKGVLERQEERLARRERALALTVTALVDSPEDAELLASRERREARVNMVNESIVRRKERVKTAKVAAAKANQKININEDGITIESDKVTVNGEESIILKAGDNNIGIKLSGVDVAGEAVKFMGDLVTVDTN